jgi:hypothetical protein
MVIYGIRLKKPQEIIKGKTKETLNYLCSVSRYCSFQSHHGQYFLRHHETRNTEQALFPGSDQFGFSMTCLKKLDQYINQNTTTPSDVTKSYQKIKI